MLIFLPNNPRKDILSISKSFQGIYFWCFFLSKLLTTFERGPFKRNLRTFRMKSKKTVELTHGNFLKQLYFSSPINLKDILKAHERGGFHFNFDIISETSARKVSGINGDSFVFLFSIKLKEI